MDDYTPLDLELHSYVDGALDDEGMARVERHLRENPETAAKVRAYLRQKTHIRAFAEKATVEGNASDFHALERQLAKRLKRHKRFPWRGFAAAAMLFVFAAGWLGHSVYMPAVSGPSYADELVQAHMLTSTDPSEVMAISPERISRLFSRIGEMEYVPDLGAYGYEPIGAQLVPSDAGAILHVPYRGADGTVVSYFLLHDQDQEEIPRHVLHREGVTLAYWQHDHSRYAVAAPLPDEQIHTLATFLESAPDMF